MPSNISLKAMNAIHHLALGISGGRIGWNLLGMPVLELTTTGRRSGEPRSVMLTSPLQQGDTLVVVASRGGDDQHPAWFLNLQEEPRVDVRLSRGRRLAMTARVASPAERDQMWPRITAKYGNYADYQKRTNREIPLVVLEPLNEPLH